MLKYIQKTSSKIFMKIYQINLIHQTLKKIIHLELRE